MDFCLHHQWAGGSNFAVGGATTGTLNFVGDGTPLYPGLAGIGIRTQIASFAGALGGLGADPTGLYVVWGGANDIFLNQALSQPQNPVASVANLAAAITDLYNLGARTLLVPNLPDVGRSPAFVGQPGAAGATALTLAFNALLAGAILNLEGTLGGLDILPFDTFALFDEVLSDLGAFGLTRQRRAICSDRRATRRGSFSGTSSIRPPPGIRYSASASSRRSSRSPTPSR